MWGAVLIFGVFFLFTIGRLWFCRVTVFDATPAETKLAIQLIITPKTIETIESVLSSTPLISNRSIDFEDIRPLIQGELGWFFSEDGSRSIAFRGSFTEVSEAFEGQSINIEQTESGILLLSESLPAISGETEGLRSPLLPSFFKTYLGQVVLPEDSTASRVFGSEGQITIQTKSMSKKRESMILPTDTIFALSTPEWTNSLFASLIDDFGAFPLLKSTNLSGFPLITDDSSVILAKTDEYTSFLLANKTQETVDVPSLLQILAASQNPEVGTTLMEDGTVAQEIRIDPDFVTIEEVSNMGITYFRAKISDSGYLLAHENNNDFVITNSEELLFFWNNPEEVGERAVLTDNDLCGATTLFANPTVLLEEIESDYFQSDFAFLNALLSRFSVISVETRNGSSNLNLCLT